MFNRNHREINGLICSSQFEFSFVKENFIVNDSIASCQYESFMTCIGADPAGVVVDGKILPNLSDNVSHSDWKHPWWTMKLIRFFDMYNMFRANCNHCFFVFRHFRRVGGKLDRGFVKYEL